MKSSLGARENSHLSAALSYIHRYVVLITVTQRALIARPRDWLTQCVWNGAWVYVFLISSQRILRLLVLGLHFENHWSRPAPSNRNVTLTTYVIWNFPVGMLKKKSKRNRWNCLIIIQNYIISNYNHIKITNEILHINFFYTKSSSSRM